MTTNPFTIYVLANLMIGWAGCELAHVEGEGDTNVPVERTYPLMFDRQTIDLSAARTSNGVRDSFTVEVRTLGVYVCPEKRHCYLPDGVTVAQLGRADSPLDTLGESQIDAAPGGSHFRPVGIPVPLVDVEVQRYVGPGTSSIYRTSFVRPKTKKISVPNGGAADRPCPSLQLPGAAKGLV